MVVKGKTHIKLQIWDTAGQESFRSITRLFYQEADAVLICYDITNRKSFESVREWLVEIENHTKEDIIKYLIGNFADMEQDRVVQKEEALKLMKEKGFTNYLETSALTGQNIDNCFQTLTKHLYISNENNLDRFREEELESRGSSIYNLNDAAPATKKKKGKCCK